MGLSVDPDTGKVVILASVTKVPFKHISSNLPFFKCFVKFGTGTLEMTEIVRYVVSEYLTIL